MHIVNWFMLPLDLSVEDISAKIEVRVEKTLVKRMFTNLQEAIVRTFVDFCGYISFIILICTIIVLPSKLI